MSGETVGRPMEILLVEDSLTAARLASPCGTPILGVHMGRFGFIAETHPNDLYPHLEEILDVSLPDLSGGELQRSAVALALARTATLYLLDEPSAYLDSDERMAMARLIRRQGKSSRNSLDKLYVPLTRMDLVEKYRGAGEAAPPLDRLGTTRQAVQRSTDELLARGLAITEANPDHRTSPFIRLTPAGHEVLARISHAAMISRKRWLPDSDAAELEVAHVVVRRLRDALRQSS